MHLMIPAHVYFFWLRCHPNRTFPPKEFKREPQNRLPLLPTARPHPLIPLTRGPPPLYWLQVGGAWALWHAPLSYESIAFLALTRLSLPHSLSDFAARSGARLTLAAWMSLWAFILCIPSLLQARHYLGMGFLFFNLAHVAFHPASVGWLVFLPCHYTALVVISLIFCLIVTSGLTGWSICHVNFLPYSFFWFLLPNIPTGPIHSITWASLAHFIPWATLARFIISYLFHSHGIY